MSKENISYIKYLPNKGNISLTNKIAQTYCDVFAGPPWNETFSKDEVVADMIKEISPKSSAWIAMDQDKVAGFTWGYPKRISDLETKLGISLNSPNLIVAYQSEIGLLSEYRGQRIAKNLVRLRNDDFLAQNLEYSVVRTKQLPVPSVTFSWYTEKLGYDIIARYPKNDGRVILGRPLAGLKELLTR